MTRIRILLILFTLVISLLTLFIYIKMDKTGLSCVYYYEEESKGPPVYTGRPRAVDVGLTKPLDLRPSSQSPLTFCFNGFFNLAKPGGEYDLCIVSNIPVKMNLGGTFYQFPNLKTQDKPKGWIVTASPLGTPYKAIDNIHQTRWDTGRPKQSGDWFAVEFGKDEKVLGLVLDNSGSSDRDCPTKYTIDVAVTKGADQKVGQGRVASKKARAVDIWFESVRARYLRVTQLEDDPVYYWSIHELYMITEDSLEQGAVKVNLSDLEPLKIEGSFTPRPSGLEEDFQIVQFFWKPPGKNWERVPQWALSPDPVKGLRPWGAKGVKVLIVILPWIWALLAALWVAVLIPKTDPPPNKEDR
ncbi:MAG: discoidin domain-containing protein [Pseudomonadota bacterium]